MLLDDLLSLALVAFSSISPSFCDFLSKSFYNSNFFSFSKAVVSLTALSLTIVVVKVNVEVVVVFVVDCVANVEVVVFSRLGVTGIGAFFTVGLKILLNSIKQCLSRNE